MQGDSDGVKDERALLSFDQFCRGVERSLMGRRRRRRPQREVAQTGISCAGSRSGERGGLPIGLNCIPRDPRGFGCWMINTGTSTDGSDLTVSLNSSLSGQCVFVVAAPAVGGGGTGFAVAFPQ